MSDDGYGPHLQERTVCRRSRTDRLFEVCSEQRRHVMIRYAGDRSTVTVEKLATIVSEETGTPTVEAAISLRHADLPALAGAGIVDYDPRSATVRYDGDDLVSELLEAVP